MRGAVPLKVLDHRHRLLADIAKVDRLSACAEQQQPIKDLEEFTRGLMDSMHICSSAPVFNATPTKRLTCKG